MHGSGTKIVFFGKGKRWDSLHQVFALYVK